MNIRNRMNCDKKSSVYRMMIMSLFVFLLTSLLLFSDSIYAKELRLNHTQITMNLGESYCLWVEGYYGKKRKWKSSNTYVATVSKDGDVNGVHAGKAVISTKVGKKTLKCKVTVKEKKKDRPYIVCERVDYVGNDWWEEWYDLWVENDMHEKWKWYVNDSDLAQVEKNRDGIRIKSAFGKQGTIIVKANDGHRTLTYKLVVPKSEETQFLYTLRANVLSQVIHQGMSQQEQCLAVAKWISDYASYSVTDEPAGSLLTNRVGQCSHYARTFDFLLDPTGIPCDCVSDNSHAWNQVLIDGEWYNVDVTSMDTARGSHDYAYHIFMVSDAAFWRKGPRELPYHECASTRYDFPGLTWSQRYYESPWADGTWRNY